MLKKLISIGLSSLFAVGTAQAGLISPTGDISNLNLRWGKTESNQIQTFNEAQNVQVNENQIQVDFLLGDNFFVGDSIRGIYNSNKSLSLAAGNYNSHLLHFDPLGISSGSIFNASISFEEEIVAIILGGRTLNATDGVFGGIGTTYQQNNSRRLERHDFLTFKSANTLTLDRLAVGKYWIDNARVITQAVPEPGSMTLFGLGLIGLIGTRTLLSKKDNRST